MPPLFVTPGVEMFDQAVLLGIKLMLLLGLLTYVVFAFIATRQIHLMRKTLITTLSPWIAMLGYVHFALAVAVFLGILFFT